MTTLEFRWSVSRARDSYGYNICSLYVDGRKAASTCGGGYDMKRTALGNYIARAYADRLLALKPQDMPAQSHWERAEKPRRLCPNVSCITRPNRACSDDSVYLPDDADLCPHCGGETRIDYHDGQTIQDGRYFYGLTYHDPNYHPGKAVIGKDISDRTMGGAEGQTVDQAEAAGKSIGLERYQAFYSASSKVPTENHTVPLVDGACGFSSVETIMKAIGLSLQYVPTRSKRDSIYTLVDTYKKKLGRTMKHYAPGSLKAVS